MDETPARTLIQITDIHIGPGGSTGDPHGTGALLGRALDQLLASGLSPAAVLLTGDLADDGTPEQYRALRELLAPALERLAVPVVYVMGNHDDRAAMREHLLGVAPGIEPLDTVAWFDGLRVVGLDSTVPGRGYGELRPGQLARLRAELAEPAPHGTVLALHHPPLPSPAPLARAIALRNRAELAAAIAGRDVRIVLAGHVHTAAAGTLAGVPVWTGGPIATTLDGLAAGETLRGLVTPGVTRIDLFADSVLATHVPVAAEIAMEVPGERMASRLAEMRAHRDGVAPR